MEEIPEIFETTAPDTSRQPVNVTEKVTDWLLHQQNIAGMQANPSEQTVAKAQEPLKFELEISPGMKAQVELGQKSEVDFDRHEVLKDEEPKQPSLSGMIPLGQILATRLQVQDNLVARSPELSKSPSQSSVGQAAGFTYRRAIVFGMVLGGFVAAGLTILIITR